MSLRAFGTSRPGLAHSEAGRENEDRFLIADLTKILRVHHTNVEAEPLGLLEDLRGHVLAVADGVGGTDHGAESSELASEILTGYLLHTVPWFVGLRPSSESDFVDELRSAFEACHKALLAKSSSSDSRYATTLTLAYVAWRRLYVAHVGDSRCYLLSDDRLIRTTRDQTMAQELVDNGTVQANARNLLPFANVLTSALGSQSDLRVQVVRANLRDGDRVLLTSGGIHEPLGDNEIAAILRRESDEERACNRLIEEAVAAGGRSDATCVLATFRESDDGPGDRSTEDL